MNKYKIALCRFPGSGWEHSGLATWLMTTFHEMKQDARVEAVLSIVKSDTPITMTRNATVKDALAAGCDYILMVDSDMSPDYLVGRDPRAMPFWKTAWDFLMRRREEEDLHTDMLGSRAGYSDERINGESAVAFPPATVAAPYCGPPPNELCFVFHWHCRESEGPDPAFSLEMIDREDAARRGGIEEVAALPTGLILYDARVFRELSPPWFDYEWADVERSEKASTEDVFQTRNASQLRLPQYVLWDSWACHVKTKEVGKPRILTADMVHASLVDSVRRGYDSREQLRFQHPHLAGADGS